MEMSSSESEDDLEIVIGDAIPTSSSYVRPKPLLVRGRGGSRGRGGRGDSRGVKKPSIPKETPTLPIGESMPKSILGAYIHASATQLPPEFRITKAIPEYKELCRVLGLKKNEYKSFFKTSLEEAKKFLYAHNNRTYTVLYSREDVLDLPPIGKPIPISKVKYMIHPSSTTLYDLDRVADDILEIFGVEKSDSLYSSFHRSIVEENIRYIRGVRHNEVIVIPKVNGQPYSLTSIVFWRKVTMRGMKDLLSFVASKVSEFLMGVVSPQHIIDCNGGDGKLIVLGMKKGFSHSQLRRIRLVKGEEVCNSKPKGDIHIGKYLCTNGMYSSYVISCLCSALALRERPAHFGLDNGVWCGNFLDVWDMVACQKDISFKNVYTFVEYSKSFLSFLNIGLEETRNLDGYLLQVIIAIQAMQKTLRLRHNSLSFANISFIEGARDVAYDISLPKKEAKREGCRWSKELKYAIGEHIADGTFSKVYKDSTGKYAIKVIDVSNITLESVLDECDTLSVLSHPNIISIVDAHRSREKVYTVSPLAEGSAHDYITRNGVMSEAQAYLVFRQLLSAVEKCHASGIAHLDIKLDNILIADFNNLESGVILGDFGLARRVDDGVKITESLGSPAYIPYEIVKGVPYDPKIADIWEMGVCLFVLLEGRFPHYSEDISEMYSKKLYDSHSFVLVTNENLKELINKLLSKSVERRWTISQIKESKWMKSMDALYSSYNPITEHITFSHPKTKVKRVYIQGLEGIVKIGGFHDSVCYADPVVGNAHYYEMGYNDKYDVLTVLYDFWNYRDRTKGYVDDVVRFVFGDLEKVDEVMSTYIRGKPRMGTVDNFPNASPERILGNTYLLKKYFGNVAPGATVLGSV